jgi:hypothetical protein
MVFSIKIRNLDMKFIKDNTLFLTVLFLSLFLNSCVQDNLDPDNYPEVGDVEDLTIPEARFSFEQDIVDFTVFRFINESISFTNQEWSIPSDAVLIGDTAQLTDENIEVKFSGEAEFTVSLVAKDNNTPVSDSEAFVETINVLKPLVPVIPTPEILGASFEDGEDGFDGRNFWGRNNSSNTIKRISGIGTIARSTGSRVRTGTFSAKFDTRPRQAYQEITVTPNVNYRLIAWIKLGNADPGLVDEDEFRLAILDKTFDTYNLEAFEAAILKATTADPKVDFRRVSVIFNSGDLETVAIFMDSKQRVEVQVDDLSIEVLN